MAALILQAATLATPWLLAVLAGVALADLLATLACMIGFGYSARREAARQAAQAPERILSHVAARYRPDGSPDYADPTGVKAAAAPPSPSRRALTPVISPWLTRSAQTGWPPCRPQTPQDERYRRPDTNRPGHPVDVDEDAPLAAYR